MTQAQMQAIATHIRASVDPAVVAALAIRNDVELARLYNLPTTFIVWRNSIDPQQARMAIVSGDQLAQLDNLTAGKRDTLLYVFSDVLDIRTSTVRDAVISLCGTQNILKAAITAAMKRAATVAEKALATGTGTDVSPGTLTFEGELSWDDIGILLNMGV